MFMVIKLLNLKNNVTALVVVIKLGIAMFAPLAQTLG